MARKINNGLDLNGQRIQNQADPTGPADSATKQYVDNLVAGLAWKQPVRAATTANITLSAPQTVDGVTLIAGDRVLVMNQTTQSANGIYVVAAGAWSRATDADAAAEVLNATVYVSEGTANADKAFTQTANAPITLNTTNLVFAQVGGGTSYLAGNGLTLAGSTFSAVAAAGGGVSVAAGGISVDHTKVPLIFATNVGDGTSTSITVTHNLGTLDVIPRLFLISTGAEEETDIVHATINTLTLVFPTAPASGAYRIVVLG